MAVRLDVPEFLDLVERTGKLVCFDLEATGLNGDYNSVLVFSCRPYGRRAESVVVEKLGQDRAVVKAAKAQLEAAYGWVSYYGKGYDIKMLNSRLLRWGLPPVEPRPHLDLYWIIRTQLNTSRRSQAHLLEWLGLVGLTPKAQRLEEKGAAKVALKMTLSPEVWNGVLGSPATYLPVLRRRCESDCEGLEALYDRIKHIVREIKR